MKIFDTIYLWCRRVNQLGSKFLIIVVYTFHQYLSGSSHLDIHVFRSINDL